MNYLVLDTECSGATNGTIANPFTDSNKLCSLGIFDGVYRDWILDVSGNPYGVSLQGIVEVLRQQKLLVGFALKFDLHWLRRYSVVSFPLPDIWDCQYAHFCITGQKNPYPSLNDVCEYYGLEKKLDVVKTEYWDKGIDTDQVPLEILLEYQKQDVMLTHQVFLKQREELDKNPQLKRLVWYGCQDLKVTAEMEWNGIYYNLESSKDIGSKIAKRIGVIDSSLCSLYPDVSINWNSGDHLSAILFGGSIPVGRKEDYLFTYKDERKAPVVKTRTVTDHIAFPRLIDPIKGSELKKEGFWSTAEPVLKKLKSKGTAKYIIDLILERTGLDTRLTRYYFGFPALYEKMEWSNSLIHSNLNHVVAASGRLSSTKPNIQNMEALMRQCVETRFK